MHALMRVCSPCLYPTHTYAHRFDFKDLIIIDTIYLVIPSFFSVFCFCDLMFVRPPSVSNWNCALNGLARLSHIQMQTA